MNRLPMLDVVGDVLIFHFKYPQDRPALVKAVVEKVYSNLKLPIMVFYLQEAS